MHMFDIRYIRIIYDLNNPIYRRERDIHIYIYVYMIYDGVGFGRSKCYGVSGLLQSLRA